MVLMFIKFIGIFQFCLKWDKNKTLPTLMTALVTGIAMVSLVTIVPVRVVVMQMQQKCFTLCQFITFVI
jgi:hypothetical protein